MSKALEEELEGLLEIESNIERDIANIQLQMSNYITCGNPDMRTNGWMAKARYALYAKKGNLKQTRARIDKIHRQMKVEKAKTQENRDRIQNMILYKKLKEVMPEAEFSVFCLQMEKDIKSLMGEE